MENVWNISGLMSEVETIPEWSVNGTTIETGRRFRFKSKDCGDYKTGYTTSEGFCLSTAMAVSAAFPGGIGPLVIDTKNHIWKKRTQWDSPPESEKVITQRFKKIHIYDGGVYDNLGTEPLFDSGNNIPKLSDSKIIVSDAGKPLFDQKHGFIINPLRLSRILDIALDQARALRVRSLFAYLNSIKKAGTYLMIGQAPSEVLNINEISIRANWLNVHESTKCAKYPTDLKKMSQSNLDIIVRHGYEAIMASNIKNKVLD
jgi:NTE family protein